MLGHDHAAPAVAPAANDNVPAPAPRSYAPEVKVDGKWCGNALRFASYDEAHRNVIALMMRWYVPTDSRVVPSNDAVNYRWTENGLEAIS